MKLFQIHSQEVFYQIVIITVIINMKRHVGKKGLWGFKKTLENKAHCEAKPRGEKKDINCFGLMLFLCRCTLDEDSSL